VRFFDDHAPELGLVFDGRVAEDFKLSSGTWVNVGMLRIKAIEALAPVAQDVVVAGHDTESVRLLIFPNLVACRALSGLPESEPVDQLLAHARIREAVANGLRKLRDAAGGASSAYVVAALLVAEPPSIDAGEITDKGYINQRAVLARRITLVEAVINRTASAVYLDA
jgi:feruloyl-CoA synthase